jgi:uncharacterized protein (TIGR02246 family)
MRWNYALCVAVLVGMVDSWAIAGDKAVDPSVEKAIRKTVAALEESFNRGDAKGVAACWTPDGEFLGPQGERIEGRAKIETAFQQHWLAQKKAKIRLGVASWRLVADNVALIDLVSEVTPATDRSGEPVSNLVLVKSDGRWLIGSMHETMLDLPTPHDHLRRLEWLVGNWIVDAPGKPDVTARSTCDWTANGSYLIRRFSIEGKKSVATAGTEVIGWDPRTHRIRSWTFEADGGFGESTWTQDGDHWIVKHVGVQADGDEVAGTYVIAAKNADMLTLQSKERTLNGAKQAEMAPVQLKRVAEDVKEKASAPAPIQRVLP